MNTIVTRLPEGDKRDAVPAQPLHIGLIGCSAVAQHHLQYLRDIPGAGVVCAADIRADALERMRTDHGVEWVFEDFRQLLQEMTGEIGAVSICAPNFVHAPAAIAAAEAGLHILCEKPMAMNVSEARAMADAAKANGVELIIGFQHRFEARSRLLRDLVAGGAMGDILYVRAQALRRRGIPNWGVFGRKELQGGGPLVDIGVHILETAHSILGAPRPVSATGGTFTYLGDKPSEVVSRWPGWDWETYTVEDLAIGTIRFETGALLTIESSYAAHIEEDTFNLQIVGTKGGADWASSKIYTDHFGLMLTATPAYIEPVDMWEYKMRHFVEVARDGRPNEASAEHGVMVQSMIEGVYASSEARSEVAL